MGCVVWDSLKHYPLFVVPYSCGYPSFRGDTRLTLSTEWLNLTLYAAESTIFLCRNLLE